MTDANGFSSKVFDTAVQTLRRLGVTPNYSGFFQTAYAVKLASENPIRLQLVTKWLYPDVAIKFKTCSDNVRKNIAKVCQIAWEKNPELLSQIATYELKKKPGTNEFLAILAIHIICSNLESAILPF